MYMNMLEVAKQQVCMSVSCMLHIYIPKVQSSLYFQHNSYNAHAVLQLLHVHVFEQEHIKSTKQARETVTTERVCKGVSGRRSGAAI